MLLEVFTFFQLTAQLTIYLTSNALRTPSSLLGRLPRSYLLVSPPPLRLSTCLDEVNAARRLRPLTSGLLG
jgi:hypothetical protein